MKIAILVLPLLLGACADIALSVGADLAAQVIEWAAKK